MKKKVQIINKSCYRTGFNGRKKQKDSFYYLIAENLNGEKIAFGVDQRNK